jgi:lipid-A-disaccharide synthase
MKIGIVAGEASGDLLASMLIQAIKSAYPQAEFIGIAGPKMQAAGATSLYAMDKLSVRGYIEVLKSYREIVGIRNGVRDYFLKNRPDFFIGIDAPDFNLGVETALRAKGIPTIHYISPSIWAWRGERIHKIKKAVDLMLTVFPFEQKIYDAAGIASVYVGHPLADLAPATPQYLAARTQLRLPANSLQIALLPGSRRTELDYHAELFIETARLLLQKFPNANFLVPLATRETREQFDAMRWKLKANELPLQVLFGHSHLALSAADCALVASGTATLEAALLRCPHAVAYRMSPTTFKMMKKKAYLPYVGLPNILAGEWIVPELLQDDATATNCAQVLGNYINHKALREQLQERFADLHASLAVNNGRRVVNAISNFLQTHKLNAAKPAISAPLQQTNHAALRR